MERDVWPGRPHPQGATFDGKGVNFAIFTERGVRVEVCLFDPENPARETRRFVLPSVTTHVHHGYVPGLQPGTLYGIRVNGPYDPEDGLRFNANKLLVDPYARAITGKVDWSGPVLGYQPQVKEDPELSFDLRDDAAAVPKGVVVDDRFDWGSDAPPNVPWPKTLIYEVQVKGFTMRHPAVPPDLRGTYAGLGHPAAIAHLQKLGVTAVELLPVHECVDEGFLSGRGLTNFWGYNTLGYFAPDQRFSSRGSRGGQVDDFKHMVKALHAAGIEVLLDVVYNHTGEGNEKGPTLSLRGIDNPSYYRLRSDDLTQYVDFTGCGNSVNVLHPQSLKLIADSLRYWVTEMHVDGFRFDLATTLGRGPTEFERTAPFFQLLHQDPVLSRVKLIAEPWDLGEGGYQVANFPVLWSEWNGRYKDSVRRFWRGDESLIAEIGYRLTGSSDLYQLGGRRPYASINYVTAHDGFTLRDLVSYNEKHNELNREENRDGSNDNHSWNCGAEGPTPDAAINTLRDRQVRNFLATLLLSQGVPMICAGDEFGRTQNGNNNAYCQDNGLSWIDWELDDKRKALLEFTTRLIQFRKSQPVLQRRRFFQGALIGDSAFKDLAWFRPDGREMTADDWAKPFARSLIFVLGGDAISSREENGERVKGDTVMGLFNGHHDPLMFTLPPTRLGNDWELVLDTGEKRTSGERVPAGEKLELLGRSIVVLRHVTAR
ncbi:MAG: glycogen debranching protein GlgX [Myxococcaceae bacterium]